MTSRYPVEELSGLVFDLTEATPGPEDVEVFLASALARVRVFVVDGSGCREVDDAEQLDEVVAAQPGSRPDEAAIHATLRAAGVTPSEAAFVHTAPGPVAASVGAGAGLVVGLDLHGDAGPLLAAGADIVISALDDLEIDAGGAWKLRQL